MRSRTPRFDLLNHFGMRQFNQVNKTRQDWERELLECLQEASRNYLSAKPPQRTAALEHYRIVLQQFNRLVISGSVPPEHPCYTEQRSA